MQDKFLMEELLFGNKVITDLYLHGYIESNCDDVRKAFEQALEESLELHTDIYETMKNAEFYNVTTVEKNKITMTKDKLEKSINCCKKED